MGATVNLNIYYIVILIIVRLKQSENESKKCDNDVALVLFIVTRDFHFIL